MSDIFISYSRKDRDKAEPIAQALEGFGWSVWWDLTIPAGKTFTEVISEALADAKCIVVLWSSNAIISNWVLDEADEGRAKNNLVPVFIEEGIQQPLGYRRIQAADLTNWDGNVESQAFEKLVSDISMIIGRPPEDKKEEHHLETEEAKHKAQAEGIQLEEEKQIDLMQQFEQPVTEKEPEFNQTRKTNGRQVERKAKVGWIVAVSALWLSALAIIIVKFMPHSTNIGSSIAINEPGVYLKANALAGAKLDDSMVTLVQWEEGEKLEPDIPLYFSDIHGWCLIKDLSQTQALTWDNIGECPE